MTALMLELFWVVTGSLLLVVALRPLVLRFFGVRWAYSLWSIVPLTLVLSQTGWALPVTAPAGIERLRVSGAILHQDWVSAMTRSEVWSFVWLIGVLAMFGWTLRMARLLVSQYRLASKSAFELRTPKRVQIWHSPQFGPCISGVWQGQLILPMNFNEQYSPTQQQLIIAHELTHWRRGDVHANYGAWLLLCIGWFHPLCWIAYRLFRQDQEFACDAAVLAKASKQEKLAYSQALLSQTTAYQTALPLVTHYQGDKQMMKQRLLSIQQQHGFHRGGFLATTVLLSGLFMWWWQPVLAKTAAKDLAPQHRIEPRYPVQAAQQGIEGYVVLKFDVTPAGSVTNVKVVKAQPEQTFEKEAARALSQWQYETSSNGQQGMLVQLDFMMDETPQDVERVQVKPSKS